MQNHHYYFLNVLNLNEILGEVKGSNFFLAKRYFYYILSFTSLVKKKVIDTFWKLFSLATSFELGSHQKSAMTISQNYIRQFSYINKQKL